ncbi:MAG: hypothetical protein HY675_03670 [Chloroflexi bacterium]|nr:hypothetical protein [Chloroflexota bacterium]
MIGKDDPSENVIAALETVLAPGERAGTELDAEISNGLFRARVLRPIFRLILLVFNLGPTKGRLASPFFAAFALGVSLLAFVPIGQAYLNTYPPAGIDFFHGVSYVAYLRQHFGLWLSQWNYSWYAGDPFIRQYGVLSTYLALPFAQLFGDGPGYPIFLVSTHIVFLVFTFLLLQELSERYVVATVLTILVAYSANVYIQLFDQGLTTQASAQMFLPACLYVLSKYLRGGSRRLLVLAALLNGLAFLAHPIVGLLILAVALGILLCGGSEQSGLSLVRNISRGLLYGCTVGSIGGVVGVPLITNLLYNRRVAAEAPVGAFAEPGAHVEMLHTTNAALLAVVVLLLCWRAYRSRWHPLQIRLNREHLGFIVVTFLLMAAQYAFAAGMNPAPAALRGWRMWWLAPILLAGVAAILIRELIPRVGPVHGHAMHLQWRQVRKPLAGLVLVLVAAAVGPAASWAQITGSLRPTELDPPIIVDALMGRISRADAPITPRWLDVHSTESRAWILNPRISMWWSAVNRLPMTGGYYDQVYKPWVDWRNWMQMAINGDLAKEPGHTPETAKNVAKYLIDWFGIRYFIISPGAGSDVRLAPYLLTPDIVEDTDALNGLQTMKLRPELSDPIISPTSTPTLLVIGDDAAYDTLIRALALANVGPRQVIPVHGPKRIDELSPEEMAEFDAVALYNYGFSDAQRAFGMLGQFVRDGGGLFVETSTSFPELSDGRDWPEPFPMQRAVRASLGMRWTLTPGRGTGFAGVDTSTFSPPVYEGGPWGLSYAPGMEYVKRWADVVLDQEKHPLMVAGTLGKGRVLWSGINLPYHVVSYVNLWEASLLADIVRWIQPESQSPGASGPNGGSGQPRLEYTMNRPTPETITLTGARFKGILFKENAMPGWNARIVTSRGSEDLKIYAAGPGLMYIPVPEGASGQLAVQLSYGGRREDWGLLILSLSTILLTLDYIVLGGRVLVNRLGSLAGVLLRPAGRIKEVLVGADEDEEE